MTTFANRHTRYSNRAARGNGRPPEVNDALVETICLAACVDGTLAEGEAATLARQIHATPGFEHLDPNEIAHMVEQILQRAGEEGIVERLRAISTALALDDQAREEAFALATLFVMYDGVVGDEEQAFLDLLQRQLHISDEAASRISALLSPDASERPVPPS